MYFFETVYFLAIVINQVFIGVVLERKLNKLIQKLDECAKEETEEEE